MSQDQAIQLALKIVLTSGIVSILAFIADYWRLAPWWKNPIGRTIVIKDFLLILCLLPPVVSLFFQFNRLTSNVAAWIDISDFGLLTPCMIWRIVVWERIHRGKDRPGDEP